VARKGKERMVEKCNICSCDIDRDNGDIIGEFGISPVAFCVWCLSSMTDMVIQFNGFDDIPTLQERIIMLREEQGDESVQAMQRYTAKLRKELKENK
jgi:hypothetical protein